MDEVGFVICGEMLIVLMVNLMLIVYLWGIVVVLINVFVAVE